MNFCIFDVITYSSSRWILRAFDVVIWWIFVSLMWLHTAVWPFWLLFSGCDLMNFCIFDVITYSKFQNKPVLNEVVIWWIFVSLMWLHTARNGGYVSNGALWFDEFLYLWCDYIQQSNKEMSWFKSCDLMNFCIFDVITYSLWVS